MSVSGVHEFDELCRSPSVRQQLETMETSRSGAMGTFRILLVTAILTAAGAAYILHSMGLATGAYIVAALIFFVGIALAYMPLAKVGQSLKHPVLEALAAQNGMEYLPTEFAPPLYEEAKKALFGSWISGQSFTDLFHGKDDRGRGIAIYEASLQRGSGRRRHTAFSGQVYAVQHSRVGGAVTVIVPDRGLLNFFKPSGGFGRVRLDDQEFERRFEVYSTEEVSAKQLLFNSTLRRLLLDLGQGGRKGKVFAYFGPGGALIAAAGEDRFEPGSMFRSKRGEERVRAMFDDYSGSMAVLNSLRTIFV